jgi:hypothetical protein
MLINLFVCGVLVGVRDDTQVLRSFETKKYPANDSRASTFCFTKYVRRLSVLLEDFLVERSSTRSRSSHWAIHGSVPRRKRNQVITWNILDNTKIINSVFGVENRQLRAHANSIDLPVSLDVNKLPGLIVIPCKDGLLWCQSNEQEECK